jgi:hypothetical protein
MTILVVVAIVCFMTGGTFGALAMICANMASER